MGNIIKYGVISDTHGKLNASVHDIFAGVQRIFHCGDIGCESVIQELRLIAPVTAVAGNMDPWPMAASLPDFLIEETEFGNIGMSHGTAFGHSNIRIAEALFGRFSEDSPRAIFWGHSHQPCNFTQNGVLFLNPGSATLPHSGEPASVAIICYDQEKNELLAEHLAL